MKPDKVQETSKDAVNTQTDKINPRKKADADVKFVGAGLDKCQICSQRARVVKVEKKLLDDGRTLITRQIRCMGKHCHTYPLKQFVGKGGY